MEADDEGCLVAINMREFLKSLAPRTREAEKVSSPSVSPDGLAVTVVLQLQPWNVSLVLIIIIYLSYWGINHKGSPMIRPHCTHQECYRWSPTI
jgi:hypothetical protein